MNISIGAGNGTHDAESFYKRVIAGQDPGFQVRGDALIKIAKNFEVFSVKNHDFTPKIIFFPILGGARAGCAPPPPPWIEWLLFNVKSAICQLYHGENMLIFNEMMM